LHEMLLTARLLYYSATFAGQFFIRRINPGGHAAAYQGDGESAAVSCRLWTHSWMISSNEDRKGSSESIRSGPCSS
jgi:hypothetical protein